MSNEERLLEYLRTNKNRITSLDAVYKLGNVRLSGTIFNLRKKGYEIRDNWETGNNRFGVKCRYKVYYLIESEENNNAKK